MTRVINIAYKELAISAGCEALEEGKPIGVPMETVYGLAADSNSTYAVKRIFQLKARPLFNPLIMHMSDLNMVDRCVFIDPLSRLLAEKFWPGPLTLILPARPQNGISSPALAGLNTIGARIPVGFASQLIKTFGRPLAAPSANRSGRISSTTATHVIEDFGERLDLVLDGGPSRIGLESTILKVEGETIHMLRPGGLDATEVERVTGRSVLRVENNSGSVEAPGMLSSHYAPKSTVRLNVKSILPGEVLIKFGQGKIDSQELASLVLNLSPSGDLVEAAYNLFTFMKQADAVGATSIAFTPIPATGFGVAINDRLGRAAAPRC